MVEGSSRLVEREIVREAGGTENLSEPTSPIASGRSVVGAVVRTFDRGNVRRLVGGLVGNEVGCETGGFAPLF